MLTPRRATQLFKQKDLRRRLLIVAGLLAGFRLFANIPIPGVDAAALQSFFASNSVLGFLNLFSGGALSNLSVAMLGLGPYITSVIIMQLLTMIFPVLKRMYYEEGEAGKTKFNRISRYATVPLAGLQGYGFLKLLASQGVLPSLTTTDLLVNVVIIIAGSMVLVWFGEIITEQKMGNGISLLIFAGIVSALPLVVRNAILSYTPSQLSSYIAFVSVALLVVLGIVLVNEGERKVPISYAKRVRGNKLYGGVSSFLPFRVGQAGVIPIIFAISLLLFPQFLGQILSAFAPSIGLAVTNFSAILINNQLVYGLVYFVLVFLFTYFYIGITFDPSEISSNLQKSGGFIPGIRPGEPTAHFLKGIVSRITFFGATFLGLIAILPVITQAFTGTQALAIGGTSILIVVAVVLETAKQIDAELTVREYESTA